MRFKRVYQNGGTTNTVQGLGLSDFSGPISALGMGVIDAFAPVNRYGRQSIGASIGKGALSGAATGATLGPVGAVVGGVVGGVTGFISGKRQKEEETRLRSLEAQQGRQYQLAQYAARAAQNPYLTTGNPQEQYFATGGELKTEFMRFKAKGGSLQKLSSDTVEVKGASHENGGVELSQGTEVEGKETIKGNYVLSNRLGFAQLHKPIAKAIGILEKKPLSPITMKSLDRLRKQEQALILLQEQVRQQSNLK